MLMSDEKLLDGIVVSYVDILYVSRYSRDSVSFRPSMPCLSSLMSQILTPISFGKFRGRLIRAHSAFRITFPTREAREVSPTHAKLERKKMYLTP